MRAGVPDRWAHGVLDRRTRALLPLDPYRYFESKEALFETIIDDAVSKLTPPDMAIDNGGRPKVMCTECVLGRVILRRVR